MGKGKHLIFFNIIKPENAETFEQLCAKFIHIIEIHLILGKNDLFNSFVRKHNKIIFTQMHSLWLDIR